VTITFRMYNLFSQIKELEAPDLVTRELGMQAYALLRQALVEVKPGGILVLDFAEVKVMDSSFFGGSILKLLRELVDNKFGERYVVLINVNASTKENITVTIRGHRLRLGLQVIEEGKSILLGQIEPNLEETLVLVNSRGLLTARDLADSLPGMAINTASNRLKKLFDLRLVQRVEETTETGRQHVYQAISA
jgi:hypothetical protein